MRLNKYLGGRLQAEIWLYWRQSSPSLWPLYLRVYSLRIGCWAVDWFFERDCQIRYISLLIYHGGFNLTIQSQRPPDFRASSHELCLWCLGCWHPSQQRRQTYQKIPNFPKVGSLVMIYPQVNTVPSEGLSSYAWGHSRRPGKRRV